MFYIVMSCWFLLHASGTDALPHLARTPSFNVWIRESPPTNDDQQDPLDESIELRPPLQKTENLCVDDKANKIERMETSTAPFHSSFSFLNSSLNLSDALLSKIGNIRFREGKIERAINCYNRAIEMNDQVPTYYRNRGICYFKLNNASSKKVENLESAARDFRRATEMDPGYVLGHRYLGTVLAELGKYDESIDALQNALKVAEGNKISHRERQEILDILERVRLEREASQNTKKNHSSPEIDDTGSEKRERSEDSKEFLSERMDD